MSFLHIFSTRTATYRRLGYVCLDFYGQPPGGNPLPAALSIDQEDSLIQLVLAQELNGVVERIEAENR